MKNSDSTLVTDVRALTDAEEADPRPMQARSKDDPATLYPTQTCFDDALEMLSIYTNNCVDESERRQLAVVHGIMSLDDQEMAHAWLESDATVYEMKFYRGERVAIQCNKGEYYDELKVRNNTVRYSATDVEEMPNTRSLWPMGRNATSQN